MSMIFEQMKELLNDFLAGGEVRILSVLVLILFVIIVIEMVLTWSMNRDICELLERVKDLEDEYLGVCFEWPLDGRESELNRDAEGE